MRIELEAEAMTFKIIDLFCGAGGMTLGFVDPRFCGGFTPVLAVDSDKPSIDTHAANFSGDTVHGSVEVWLADRPTVPKADVVIGGPPCQGFSLLNKNRHGDARRALWEPYLDIVAQSEAKMFVMENVSELYKSPELRQIEDRADEIGFTIMADVSNAADYGVPQTRKRTVIIGWDKKRTLRPTFPPARTHSSPDLLSGLPPWRTVRDAIGDLKEPEGTEIRQANAPYNLHLRPKSYRDEPRALSRCTARRKSVRLDEKCTEHYTCLLGAQDFWWNGFVRPALVGKTFCDYSPH